MVPNAVREVQTNEFASLTLSGTGKPRIQKMIEKVIDRKNMLRAYRQVLSNKGSAGVDGMPVIALSEHLDKNRGKIALEVCNGNFRFSRVTFPFITVFGFMYA